MLSIPHYRIMAIGRVRRRWIQEGINLYLRRLPGVTVTELRAGLISKESEAVSASLHSNEIMTVLTEEGETLTSEAFARRLESYGSQWLVFIIGGPEGLSPRIKDRAHWRFSLSRMTLPHELARLMLVEQLFRAQSILRGSPYHRF